MDSASSSMHARLDGQVAIVTGAGTGIGRATATAFAREGCRVALVGRRADVLLQAAEEVRSTGAQCLVQPADVVDSAAVEDVVREVMTRWGRVDALVNSAGVNVPRRDMASVSEQDWSTVLAVNLTGTFLMTRAVLPVMREQRSGTVLNVSSTSGFRASPLTGPAYNAAKAGVVSFTESLNLSERRHGIRACAVCPGEVATPLLEKRPHPPSAAAREAMLQAEDLAQTMLLVATLPQRATVELIVMHPTVLRDWRDELM